MAQAQSSYGTYLLEYDPSASGNNKYKKVIDIIDYSDLEEQPETIDTTTLSDDTETNIAGIKRLGSGISCSVLVNPTKFMDLRAVAEAHTEKEYVILFKNKALEETDGYVSNFTAATAYSGGAFTPSGADFAVYFNATITIVQNGAGVDEALKATLTLYPQKNQYLNKVISYVQPQTHMTA